jgi:hypothetical protein
VWVVGCGVWGNEEMGEWGDRGISTNTPKP